MRISDAVLEHNTGYSVGDPVLDLSYGGQFGFIPNFGMKAPDGKTYEEWISNHAYVSNNLIPVVLSYPKALDFMPEPEKWIRYWKSLMEVQALGISGFEGGLTVETDEHPVGGAGEMQEEVTDVKRARSNVGYRFKERSGKAIMKFYDFIIRYLLKDPDTKKPLITRYVQDLSEFGGMYTPDYYTGSTLYIEPDITHTSVVDAWLMVNQFPKSNGSRTAKRELTSAGETIELNIDFAGIGFNNIPVIQLAQHILPQISALKKIPDLDLVLPQTDIDPVVKATNVGFDRVP